jgi:uncharacterized protein (DUF488 family)
VKIFTIGFTKKTAEQFFGKISSAPIRRLVDVRLNNVSQLAGFAKKNDLAYFLEKICSVGYSHLPNLAPTQPMLDGYKKGKGTWDDYARDFNELMKSRRIEEQVPRSLIEDSCLLCSEDKPHHCHRRLVAEYLAKSWDGVEVIHL